MRRIRILRVLLPAALLLFLAAVVVSLNQRPSPQLPSGRVSGSAERFGRGIDIVSLKGERAELDARAELVEPRPDGSYHLEGIEHLAVSRADRGPLVVERAAVADIVGPVGQRRIQVRDRIVVLDPQDELRVTLPALDVDEQLGQARSSGEIGLEGPHLRGKAAGIVYGLKGQPSELSQPAVEGPDGGVLRADRMLLWDGVDDVELEGQVAADRGAERMRASRLRLWRDEQHRLQRGEARGGVTAHVLLAPAAEADLAAELLEVRWNTDGEPEFARLTGDATVSRDAQQLSAQSIVVAWDAERKQWDVEASGTVYLRGPFAGGAGWLRAERVQARLDALLQLQTAEARGQLRFENPSTRAEADQGRIERVGDREILRLEAAEPRKARLARARTRLAAARITTDVDGTHLEADGRVEATLLPDPQAGRAVPGDGLFRPEEPIHLVGDTLQGENEGARLIWRGNVRSWQGERNLAAEEIEIDQQRRTLHARRAVTTRIPRSTAPSEYVQIAADRLDYDEAARLAVYQGEVRVSVREGWLEGDRVEARVLAEGSGIDELWAKGRVRIEFRPLSVGEAEIHVGTGDRLEYRPAEQVVRLFGDSAPATVRRLGPTASTTTGRELRYRLDLGTLEVVPPDRAPARIRGQ